MSPRTYTTGQVAAPGFIGLLDQSEASILLNPHRPFKICQGITPEVTGQGNSAAHLADELPRFQGARYEITPDWRTFGQYFAYLESHDGAAGTYAYPAWGNTFLAFIPPWAHEVNEWQAIPCPQAIQLCVIRNPKLPPLQGKAIARIATLRNKDPIDTMFGILIEDDASTMVTVPGVSKDDVKLALLQPWTSIDDESQGTAPDGRPGQEHPQPQAYGASPGILRKFTGCTAFDNPNQLSEDFEYALVNGDSIIDAGKMTNVLPGKVLRGPGTK